MRRFLPVILALLALGLAGEARAQGVGAVSVLEPVTSRIASAGGMGVLALRDPVFLNDRIATSTDGSTRITFVDASELTIGPNSDVVIDRFVFSPAGIESAVVRIGVGAVRFVGGASRHDLTILGPTATVGVRGTAFDFYADFFGGELLHVHRGLVGISVGGGLERLVQAGQFALVQDGEIVIGQVVGSILPVMDRFGFPYPRGLAQRFLAAADAPSRVTVAEVRTILARGPAPVLRSCDGLVPGSGAWNDRGCGPVPGPGQPVYPPGYGEGSDGQSGGGQPGGGQSGGGPSGGGQSGGGQSGGSQSGGGGTQGPY